MVRGSDRSEAQVSRALLSRRDWLYLLSLLGPVIIYDLILKGLLIRSRSGEIELAESFGLIQSDVLFNLGYLLLWVGLFALTRKGISRTVVVILFHVVTIIVVLVTTSAYRYYKVTGSTLDSDYLLLWLSSPNGTGGAVASELTFSLVVLVLIVFFYAIIGPRLVTRFVARWRAWPGDDAGTTARVSRLRISGVGLAVYALFAFSLLPPGSSVGTSKAFSRDSFVNVVVTAAQVAENEGVPEVDANPAAEDVPEASLQPTAEAEKRNVVLIFLESTRAGATTPYNEDLKTTPFLDELAKKSLLVDNAYTVVPHTHNAITATNCGIEPPVDRWGTKLLSIQDRIPSKCLPKLLKEQGYDSVYFMSQAQSFENSAGIMENLGYDEFYPVDGMDTEGFEPTNYFGYEDDVMLGPSEKWLKEHKDGPFLATYLTSAPHHDYLAPQGRYGRVEFTPDDLVNRYLNSVRYEDFFLRNLFDQYKKLGLYDDTVFIILGDHGEGFGEHGRFQHDNTIYEEGLRIPMLVHDPKRFQDGATLEGPVNQLDILPTVASLLGYKVQGGEYVGSSLLEPISKDRTLMFSCWNDKGCLASLKGSEKYIYHFDDQPEELFDLSKDRSESRNLADERSPEELDKLRSELLEWRTEVHEKYGTRPAE